MDAKSPEQKLADIAHLRVTVRKRIDSLQGYLGEIPPGEPAAAKFAEVIAGYEDMLRELDRQKAELRAQIAR